MGEGFEWVVVSLGYLWAGFVEDLLVLMCVWMDGSGVLEDF